MRILFITLILFNFLSCQEQDNQSENKKNEMIFLDAKGTILSESEKDSIIENTNGLQALRRIDNELKKTEYILFKDYEDLRGFLSDEAIDNLVQEADIMKSGGRAAVINKKIVDRWKDKKLPEGTFRMLDGSTKSFKEFEGSVLVLNFWYINCGPCISEMPYLNKLVNNYKDEDITFLALSFDSIPDIRNFLERTDFIYQQGSIDRKFMYDFTPVSPAHFIIDNDGFIRDILIGAPRNTSEIYNSLISVIEKNKK